jgi:hypothetical protein
MPPAFRTCAGIRDLGRRIPIRIVSLQPPPNVSPGVPPLLPRFRKARPRPWLCVAINQLGFPGLGTMMAGRRRVGYVQAGIMLVGFFLVMAWMLGVFTALFRLMGDASWTEAEYRAAWRNWNWAGLAGVALSLVAWVLALVSSIEILREARHTPPVLPPRPNREPDHAGSSNPL